MNNFRRRLSSEDKDELTLSADSYSATPGASTRYVYAYYGGDPITDLTTSMISNSNTSLMSFSVDSTGKITVSIKSLQGNTSLRTGTLTLTYLGLSVTYTVTQNADYIVSLTEGTNTTYNHYSVSSDLGYEFSFTATSSTACYNTYPITITLTADVYSNVVYRYASGYITTKSTLKNTHSVTQTIGAGLLVLWYTITGSSYQSKVTSFSYSGTKVFYKNGDSLYWDKSSLLTMRIYVAVFGHGSNIAHHGNFNFDYGPGGEI